MATAMTHSTKRCAGATGGPKRLPDFFSGAGCHSPYGAGPGHSPLHTSTGSRSPSQLSQASSGGAGSLYPKSTAYPPAALPASALTRTADKHLSGELSAARGEAGEGGSLASMTVSAPQISEQSLQLMLLSLKDIQGDSHSSFDSLSAQLKAVEGRIDHVERKMGEYSTTINDFVDGNQEHTQDLQWLKVTIIYPGLISLAAPRGARYQFHCGYNSPPLSQNIFLMKFPGMY